MKFKKWECIVCGLIYDEELGWPDDGIEPGTAWEDVPEEIKKTLFMIEKRLKPEESSMFGADMEKLAEGIADASSKKSFLGRITHASNEQVNFLHQMIEEVRVKS